MPNRRHQDLQRRIAQASSCDEKMKNFFFGFLGALTVLIAFLLLLPLYSDYRARSEVVQWMLALEALQAAVAQEYARSGKLDVSRKLEEADSLGIKSVVTDGNVLIIQGGRENQLLVMLPKVVGNEVRWSCWVGPGKAKPSRCQPLPMK